MELEIRHGTEDQYDILSPQGEIDLASYPALRDRINQLVATGRSNLVVDLSDTSFLDSTALGALIGGRRKAYGAGGSFAIICDSPRLLKLFTVTKLDLVFTVLPSREAWRESVGV